MYKILKATCKDGHLVLNEKLSDEFEGKTFEVMVFKVQLGENHPDYARSLDSLASLYQAMGRLTDAEPFYLQAMEARKVQLGENHPDYARSLNSLASLYQAMGRLADAEPLYRQAMEIFKMQLGENHPDYASSLNNLAILMVAMKRPDEAFQLMQEENLIQTRMIGEISSISSDQQRREYMQQNSSQLEDNELAVKKQQFFDFVKQHSFNLPDDYQFNRDELYER
ncbi:tetratricopeptide repeat protein [Laspinema sp. D1]|uniref:Tetratricopeptide repeat protein n=1 Tax=Laspinema palackyanum D2a TaxID=2953684 RepID=A0ABT2MSE4_9CYAN|nr:tetratricopeptide repeat protein [Laspinema sp. D2a]